MKIKDRTYGLIEIRDPLIIDLINSAPMQRLKHINQYGGPRYLEPRRDTTRFEHSVGVWYLLERYGAGKEEQVAGLLHDTPHTAFSHVIDAVFPNENHVFHEKFAEKIILNSDIPTILEKHGIKVKKILDKELFHLLDADLPDLSADRIDYFLRDTRFDQLFPDWLVKKFLEGLFVKDSKFYFKDSSLASLYAILFLNASRLLWLDPNSHGSFILLARAITRALELGLLIEDDFFKTDDEIFETLRKSKDSGIKKYMDRLTPKTRFIYADKAEAEFFGINKPRTVDPWVWQSGKLIRISTLTPRLKELFEHYVKTYQTLGVKYAPVG